MARTAYLPMPADRYTPCVRTVRVVGLDLTGIAQRMQLRLGGDVPGAPLVDLQSVTSASAQGLWLKSVAVDDQSRPVSTVVIRINETTVEGLPYSGELGTATELSYDWQVTISGDKRRLARGPFLIGGDGVTGADAAPADRAPSYGHGGASPQPWSGATLTFGDESVTIVVDSADLVAPLAEDARRARDAVRPMYGTGRPSDAIGIEGSFYRDMTDPLNPLEWFRTAAGWQGPQSLKGTPGGYFGDVGPKEAINGATIAAGVTQFWTSDGGRWVPEDAKPASPVAGTKYGADAVAAFPHAAAKTANGRFFRRSSEGGIDFGQFGDPTGQSYSDDAWDEAQAYLMEIARRNSRTFAFESAPILFPTYGQFRFSRPVQLRRQALLLGVGHANPFGRLSQLLFDPGINGIIVQRHNTTGVNDTTDGTTGSGARSILRGLAILSRDENGNPGYTAPTSQFAGSGVMFRATGELEMCEVDGFSGNGVSVVANSGGGAGSYEGEASESRIRRCVIQNHRENGIVAVGADVNILMIEANRLIQNGGYAILNIDAGPCLSTMNHFAANGRVADGYGQAPTSLVYNAGRLFGLRWNADPTVANKAGNGPPSSGDNAYWVDINRPAGGALPNVPQWTAGMSLRNGGICLFKAMTKSVADYGEGTQAPGWTNLNGRPAGTGFDSARYESTRFIEYQP